MTIRRLLPTPLPAVATAAALALTPLAASGDGDHHGDHRHDGKEIPFAEAELFFELNDTDGDLGIHALIDGEPWRTLEIEDPYERKMLNVRLRGRLRKQGLTEIFFESAEPTFDELAPAAFFKRFPRGTYEIGGKTLEREELESEAELTHVMPAPADGITLNGYDAGPISAERCDDEDDGYDPLEIDAPDGTVTISWAPVMLSHPDPAGGGAGVQPPVGVSIHNYQVVVEVSAESEGEEYDAVFSTHLPPWRTSVTVPAEFVALGDEFKYEILARELSYNQTAVESCFKLADD